MSDLPLIVTPGDPAGIGPEITLKAAAAAPGAFVVIGDMRQLEDTAHNLQLDVSLTAWQPGEALRPDSLGVLPMEWQKPPVAGQPDTDNAMGVVNSIRSAVELCKNKQAKGIVTNPIAKSILYKAGFSHPGHTEFLAHLDGKNAKPIMMLANDELRVVPLTIHQSLRSVADDITTDAIIKMGEYLNAALKRDFAIKTPKIAICGLNPHAGEDGHLGTEDIDHIIPAIEYLTNCGVAVSGPHPADTLFTIEARQNYDAALGMYHDQVLIPVKTIDFHGSVNITLNLSFVRTSPDHGTAFDIAGKGIAKADSLIAALRMAEDLASCRDKFDGASKDIRKFNYKDGLVVS